MTFAPYQDDRCTRYDVSRFMDPDEMVTENDLEEPAEPGESNVMGVTNDSLRFVRASNLLTCEWCNNTGIHPAEVLAVKPENHAVMMCNSCMPEPPEEWL